MSSTIIATNKWLVKDSVKKLRQPSTPVTFPLSDVDIKTMEKLIAYVDQSQEEEQAEKKDLIPAVGLAAPQIGVNKQMYYVKIVYPAGENTPERIDRFAMINPKIIAQSEQQVALRTGEGCLSVDQVHEGYVPRSAKIMIEGYDFLQAKDIQITAGNYTAIVFQHEQEHLIGKLYYDHIDETNPWSADSNLIII